MMYTRMAHAFGEERFLEHMEDFGIQPALQKMIRDTREAVPDVEERVRD